MLSVWTKHLKDRNEIERFKNSVNGSKIVLERIQDILKEKMDTLDKLDTSPETYNNPGWQYLQAHRNGFREYHQYVNKLLNLDQKEI